MAGVIEECVGSTWNAIDAWCDALTDDSDSNPYFAPRGQAGTGHWPASMDTLNWCMKLNLALCSAAVPKQEVEQSLPSPHQLAEYGRKSRCS